MKKREVYAVYHFERGWLMDTCAGGQYTGFDTFTAAQDQAKNWETAEAATREIDACDLELGAIGKTFEIVALTQP